MQELDLTKRVEVLETLLEGLAPLSIAFSGGFYSRFLIFMAARLGLEIDIFHGAGPHIPASETAFARSWVDIVDLPFHEYMLDPLEIPAVEAGAKDRCDACTHALFASLRETVEEESTLCGGSTYSDDPACYSTVKNLEAFDVRSPLAEAMLSKEDCRRIALALGMDRPWQVGRPCLLTRLPFASMPTQALLARIDAMEDVAYHVFSLCYPELPEVPDFRIRFVPESIEMPDEDAEYIPYLLHVAADVAPSIVEALVEAYTAERLPVPQVFAVQSVSGYFSTKP